MRSWNFCSKSKLNCNVFPAKCLGCVLRILVTITTSHTEIHFSSLSLALCSVWRSYMVHNRHNIRTTYHSWHFINSVLFRFYFHQFFFISRTLFCADTLILNVSVLFYLTEIQKIKLNKKCASSTQVCLLLIFLLLVAAWLLLLLWWLSVLFCSLKIVWIW